MNRPSDYFLGAILRGFDVEARTGNPVTPSAIWSRICMEAIRQPGAFEALFAWDTRKASQNRIGTIMDCLERRLVPGLALKLGPQKRGMIVVQTGDVECEVQP